MDIVVGDITELEVDAIVNPTNTMLMPQEGIPAMVFRNGGARIQVECNSIRNKIQKLPVGAAVITSGGDLRALNVIHTACPRMGMGKEAQKLKLCVINSLKLLDQKNLNSIAFPLISTGQYGFTVEQSAEIMVRAIREYFQSTGKLKSIIFCLEDQQTFNKFNEALIKLQAKLSST